MSVKIIKTNQKSFPLRADDFIDGKAYESGDDGTIYIANHLIEDKSYAKAFSVCGRYIVSPDNDEFFREVNLTITVED